MPLFKKGQKVWVKAYGAVVARDQGHPDAYVLVKSDYGQLALPSNFLEYILPYVDGKQYVSACGIVYTFTGVRTGRAEGWLNSIGHYQPLSVPMRPMREVGEAIEE